MARTTFRPAASRCHQHVGRAVPGGGTIHLCGKRPAAATGRSGANRATVSDPAVTVSAGEFAVKEAG